MLAQSATPRRLLAVANRIDGLGPSRRVGDSPTPFACMDSAGRRVVIGSAPFRSEDPRDLRPAAQDDERRGRPHEVPADDAVLPDLAGERGEGLLHGGLLAQPGREPYSPECERDPIRRVGQD